MPAMARPSTVLITVPVVPDVEKASTLTRRFMALGRHDELRPTRVDLDLWEIGSKVVLRGEDGTYWTGWVYGETRSSEEVVYGPSGAEPRNVYWPDEQTTYTAAAVILAVDALGETHGHSTAGSGIMRGTSLAPHFRELMLGAGQRIGDTLRLRWNAIPNNQVYPASQVVAITTTQKRSFPIDQRRPRTTSRTKRLPT